MSRKHPGLNWLNFFVADVQTGFGPFVAAYLTENQWSQGEIGLALSIGTATAMVSQIPAGAFVDALTRKRLAAALAILAISFSAVLLAFSPTQLPVFAAEVLHGFASCMLGPAIAAITLALVGRAGLGERLGINARWGALGNGLSAAAMGWLGDTVSPKAVFWLTAGLGIPALAALSSLRPAKAPPSKPVVADAGRDDGANTKITTLLRNRALLTFGGCMLLFQLANAAMLNLAAGEATTVMDNGAQLVIAACIIVPQVVVVLLSPWIGRTATRRGRRPILVLGLIAVPLRALLFYAIDNPYLLVPIQVLDGISAAMIGVMLPLVAADIAGDRGRYNLCIGILGFAAGIGATFSTSMAGFVSDAFGTDFAFLLLAGAGAAAVLLAWLAMPETTSVVEPAVAEPATSYRASKKRDTSPYV